MIGRHSFPLGFGRFSGDMLVAGRVIIWDIAASIFVFQGLKAFCKEAIYTEEVQVDQTCFLFGLGILYMEHSKDQFWVLDLCYSNHKISQYYTFVYTYGRCDLHVISWLVGPTLRIMNGPPEKRILTLFVTGFSISDFNTEPVFGDVYYFLVPGVFSPVPHNGWFF